MRKIGSGSTASSCSRMRLAHVCAPLNGFTLHSFWLTGSATSDPKRTLSPAFNLKLRVSPFLTVLQQIMCKLLLYGYSIWKWGTRVPARLHWKYLMPNDGSAVVWVIMPSSIDRTLLPSDFVTSWLHHNSSLQLFFCQSHAWARHCCHVPLPWYIKGGNPTVLSFLHLQPTFIQFNAFISWLLPAVNPSMPFPSYLTWLSFVCLWTFLF